MASWRERKRTNFETVAKWDSNMGSLDCESDILPLSYRVPHVVPHECVVPHGWGCAALGGREIQAVYMAEHAILGYSLFYILAMNVAMIQFNNAVVIPSRRHLLLILFVRAHT